MKLFKQILCFLCCLLMANPLPLLAGNGSSRPVDRDPHRQNPRRQSPSRLTLPPSGLGEHGAQLSVITTRTRVSPASEAVNPAPLEMPVAVVRHWDPDTYEIGTAAAAPSPSSSPTPRGQQPSSLAGVSLGKSDHTPRNADRKLLNLVYIFALKRGCERSPSSDPGTRPPEQMWSQTFSQNPTYQTMSVKSFDLPGSTTDYIDVGDEDEYETPVFAQEGVYLARKAAARGPRSNEPRYLIPVSDETGLYVAATSIQADPLYVDQGKEDDNEYLGFGDQPVYDNQTAGAKGHLPSRTASSVYTVQTTYDLASNTGVQTNGEDVGFGSQPLYDNQMRGPNGNLPLDGPSAAVHEQPEYALASHTGAQTNGQYHEQPEYALASRPGANTNSESTGIGDQSTYDVPSALAPGEEGYYHVSANPQVPLDKRKRPPLPNGVPGSPDDGAYGFPPLAETSFNAYQEPADPNNLYEYAETVAQLGRLPVNPHPPTYLVPNSDQPGIYDEAAQKGTHTYESTYARAPDGTRLWLRGQRFPIADAPIRTKVLKIHAFGLASTTVLWYELVGGLGVLVGTAPMPDALQFFFTGTPTVRTLYSLSEGPHPLALTLGVFFLFPVAAGILKAKYTRPLSDEGAQKAFKKIQSTLSTIPPSVWQDYLAYFVPVKTELRRSMALLSQELWDARLWDQVDGLVDPHKIVEALITSHGGFTKLSALELLGQVASFEERDFQDPRQWAKLFNSRNKALSFLKEQARSRTLYGLYARSCLSSLGQTGRGEAILWATVGSVPYVLAILASIDVIRTMVDLLQGSSPPVLPSDVPELLGNTGLNCSLPNQPNCSSAPAASTSPLPSPTAIPATSSAPIPSSSVVPSSTPIATSPSTTAAPAASSSPLPSPTAAPTTSSAPIPSSSPVVPSPTSSATPASSSAPVASSSPLPSSTAVAVTTPLTTPEPLFTTTTPSPQQVARQCLSGILRSFLTIPGRPVNQLLDALETYPMPEGSFPFELDLSQMIPNGTYVAQFVQGFRTRFPNVTITSVDLSGVFFPSTGLNDVLSVLPRTIQSLDLSTNTGDGVTYTAPILPANVTLFGRDRFPELKRLDLSGGRLVSTLPGLLSVLAALNNAPQLEEFILRFPTNPYTILDRAASFPAFMEALGRMVNMTQIDLTQNFISRLTPQTMPLAYAIGNMTRLEKLILDHNNLGNDPTGTDTLLRNLPSSLQVLSLLNNALGKIPTTPTATHVLGQKLSTLTGLQQLDLTWNYLARNTSLQDQLALATSLPQPLEALFIMVQSSQAPQWDSSVRDLFRSRFGNLTESDMAALCNATEVEDFFDTLPLNQSRLDLSRRLVLVDDVINTLAQRLPSKANQLTELSLADNNLEAGWSANYSVTLAGASQSLEHLEFLNISANLMHSSGGISVVGGDWNLDVPTSSLPIEGIEAFLQAITTLPRLRIFDGSQNRWGNSGLNQTLFLQALIHRPIEKLFLNNAGLATPNAFMQTLGTALPLMTNLTTLDLSGNSLGANRDADNPGIRTFFQGLSQASQLTDLNLGDNRFDNYHTNFGSDHFPTHGQDLAAALPNLTNLTNFRIDHNPMVTQDTFYNLYPEGSRDVGWILGNLSSNALVFVDFAGLTPPPGYWDNAGSKWNNLTLEVVESQCPALVGGDIADLLQNTSSSQPGRRSIESDPFWVPTLDDKSFFVTSGASHLKPPAIFDIFPLVVGLIQQTYRQVLSPSPLMRSPYVLSGERSLPFFHDFQNSHNGTLSLKDGSLCDSRLLGSACFNDPEGQLPKKTDHNKEVSIPHPRAPELDAALLGIVGVICGVKSLCTWLVSPKEESAPIKYACRKDARIYLQQTQHYLKKTTTALDALGDKTDQDFFGESLQDYKDTFSRLQELRDSGPAGLLTSVPLEELQDLKADVEALLEELESQLTENFAVKRHGRWVVDYIPSKGNTDLDKMGQTLETLKRDLKAMHPLLPEEDRFMDYARLFLELETTHDALKSKTSIPELALTSLAQKLQEFTGTLAAERAHHYIEERHGLWVLDLESYETAAIGVERTHGLLEEGQKAFRALLESSLLSPDQLSPYSAFLNDMVKAQEHLDDLFDRSNPGSLSLVPTKGVLQLQTGLEAFLTDMRRILHV